MRFVVLGFIAFGLGFAVASGLSVFFEWKYDRRLEWLSSEMERQRELQQQYRSQTSLALARLKMLDGKIGATKEEYETEARHLRDVVQRIASQVDVAFSDNDKNDNLQERIVQELHISHRIIRIAMYTFTSRIIADQLEALRKKGIVVKLLVDRGQLNSIASMTAKCRQLSHAGAEVRTIDISHSQRGPFFHHKYCVVDEAVLITGSHNWTIQGDRENHENILVVSNPVIAERFANHFDRIWPLGHT
jgi:phosphatidylserine/phosphatidylglycerophosphate/cardiolipin synthase-like enzyme